MSVQNLKELYDKMKLLTTSLNNKTISFSEYIEKLYELKNEAEKSGLPFAFEADAFIKNLSISNPTAQPEYDLVTIFELDEESSEDEEISESSESEYFDEDEQEDEQEDERENASIAATWCLPAFPPPVTILDKKIKKN